MYSCTLQFHIITTTVFVH